MQIEDNAGPLPVSWPSGDSRDASGLTLSFGIGFFSGRHRIEKGPADPIDGVESTPARPAVRHANRPREKPQDARRFRTEFGQG